MVDSQLSVTDDYKRELIIGAFRVDIGALSMDAGEGPVRIKPKAMAVLLELARQPGLTVTREELLDRVWKNRFTTPGVVGHAITALRRAFGDDPEAPTYIETIPRIGYRLVAPARFVEAATALGMPSTPGAEPEARPDVPPSAATGRRRWPLGALVAVAVALVAAATWLLGSAGGVSFGAADPSLAVSGSSLVTHDLVFEIHPRVSPDGRQVAYVRPPESGLNLQLYLQPVDGGEARQLTEDPWAAALLPAWSPDGRHIAYLRSNGNDICEIRVLSLDESTTRHVIACDPRDSVRFDWHPVDARLMAVSMVRRGQPGGSRIQLLELEGEWRLRALDYPGRPGDLDVEPRFSPDGRHIAFRRGAMPYSDILVIPVEGGEVHPLTRLKSHIQGFDWLPDGSGVVFGSDHTGRNELFHVGWTGVPEALGVVEAEAPDVARNAWRMVYQLQRRRTALVEVGLSGRDGILPELQRLDESSGRDWAPALSPDEASVAFVSDRNGSQQLWLVPRRGGAAHRLTNHAGARLARPAWSRDGQRILYLVRRPDRDEVWEHNLSTGAGIRLHASEDGIRALTYADADANFWMTAWQEGRWRLLRCIRQASHGCALEDAGYDSLWVDPNGEDEIALTMPEAPGQAVLVKVPEMTESERLPLLPNEGWSVSDRSLVFLQRQTDGRYVLGRRPERDGEVSMSELALPPILFSRPQVSRDRSFMIYAATTENRTDVGAAWLHSGGLRAGGAVSGTAAGPHQESNSGYMY